MVGEDFGMSAFKWPSTKLINSNMTFIDFLSANLSAWKHWTPRGNSASCSFACLPLVNQQNLDDLDMSLQIAFPKIHLFPTQKLRCIYTYTSEIDLFQGEPNFWKSSFVEWSSQVFLCHRYLYVMPWCCLIDISNIRHFCHNIQHNTIYTCIDPHLSLKQVSNLDAHVRAHTHTQRAHKHHTVLKSSMYE